MALRAMRHGLDNEMVSKKNSDLYEEINLGGVKYMKEKNRVVRSIWVFVFLTFLILTFVQIGFQIAAYLKGEISTNVDVDYPTEVMFPAVAICNNNQFRISHVASKEVLERVPADKRPINRSYTVFQQVMDTMWDYPADEFLKKSAHTLNGSIVSCLLTNNQPCDDPRMWTQMWTLDGLCWVFNLMIDDPMMVNLTGPEHGLRLVLNTESSERMMTCGQTDGDQGPTGFKVLIFNQTDRPISTVDGVSVMPGVATNIPFKTVERNKYKDSGECTPDTEETIAARHDAGSEQNIRSCAGRVYQQEFERVCKCSLRNLFTGIDDETGGLKKCDVDQYFGCVVPIRNLVRTIAIKAISEKCKPPCDTLEYLPQQDVSQLPPNLMPAKLTEDLEPDEEMPFVTTQRMLVGYQPNGTRIYVTTEMRCENSEYIRPDKGQMIRDNYEQLMETRWRYEDKTVREYVRGVMKYTKQIKKMEKLGYPVFPNENVTQTVVETLHNNVTAECLRILNATVAAAPKLNVSVWLAKSPQAAVKWADLSSYLSLHENANSFKRREISMKNFADAFTSANIPDVLSQEFSKYFVDKIEELYTQVNDSYNEDKDSFLNAAMSANSGSAGVKQCVEGLPKALSAQLALFRSGVHAYKQSIDNAFTKVLPKYLDLFKFDDKFEKEHFAVVNVYMVSNAVEKWSQHLEYTFASLACDIGGGLGLFLGASVVTVLEIAYVIYQHCASKQRVKKIRDNDNGHELRGKQ